MSEITEADVIEFLRKRLERFRGIVPGYCSVTIELRQLGDAPPAPRFCAYNEICGHQESSERLDDVIDRIEVSHGTKTRVQHLRDQAAQLSQQADEMERRGSRYRSLDERACKDS